MHWHSLPREVFKKRADVALRDVVSGHGGGGLVLDYMISEVFSNLNDCESGVKGEGLFSLCCMDKPCQRDITARISLCP